MKRLSYKGMLIASIAIAAWFVVASVVLAWVFPIALLGSFYIGWLLARRSSGSLRVSVLSTFGLPFCLAAGSLLWALLGPPPAPTAFPVHIFFVLHPFVSLGAFLFVRTVLEPAEVVSK